MQKIELGEVQERFANMIWELEPIKSMELVNICKERLEWNKSTTFTVLRKLCEKGLFKNENGILAAFVSDKSISDKEVDEIKSMIDEYKKSLR